MSSYHFKNGKRYKKRRALITLIGVLGIIAIAMAGYLFMNRGESAATSPTDSSKSASAQTDSATSTNTPVPSDESSVATTTSDSDTTLNGVNTKDHGFLPYIGSVNKSGKMDGLKKIITEFTAGLSG